MATLSEGQVREAISNQAAAHKAFRTALIANPKATVENAIGSYLPDFLEVVVVEDSDTKIHFVIPPFNTELSDDQLEAVAGGFLGGIGKAGGGGGGINQSGHGNVACIGRGGLVNSNLKVDGSVKGA